MACFLLQREARLVVVEIEISGSTSQRLPPNAFAAKRKQMDLKDPSSTRMQGLFTVLLAV
jgi:hypothetical protein